MRRDRSITEVPLGSGDPLWLLEWLDDRFAPRDPLFDGEELPPDPPDPPVPGKTRKPRPPPDLLPFILIAVAALAGACGGRVPPDERRPLALHATDSILVQLEPGAVPPPAPRDDGTGPPIVALTAIGPEDEPPLLRLPIPAGEDAEAFARSVEAKAGVAFAEPVYLYRPSRIPNDPRFKDLWGLAKIDAAGAWRASTGDRTTVVAIVDDGVAITHPDLAPNIWANPEASLSALGEMDRAPHGWSFVDGTADVAPRPDGRRFHGTHVAGIIGAAGDNHLGVTGVSWTASLLPIRALANEGRSDRLAQAIDYAVDHGARVVNASWGGGGRSRALEAAIARAGRRGTLVVVAAGNGGSGALPYPAASSLDNLLSVGATGPDDRLADFSNRGALLAAPGVGILSTTAPGDYERYDGTSTAAPHVAGLAALLWSAHPDATVAQVRDAIEGSAVPLAGVLQGRIDARAALARLDAVPKSPSQLVLSRAEVAFAAAAGRVPRAQVLEVRSTTGAQVHFSTASTARWLRVQAGREETPAHLALQIDPSRLPPSGGEASVTFTSLTGDMATALVTARAVVRQTVFANGMGCDLHGGTLRVRAGSSCSLGVVGVHGAPSMRWRLPGGIVVGGARLEAQFVRTGSYEILVGADEGEADRLKVTVE